MFCTKCGGRIPPEASKCPNCGADLPVMEYCGGFWSELNQNTQSGAKEAMTAGGQEEVREKAAGTAAEDPRTEAEDAFAQAPPVSGEGGASKAEDRKSTEKPARRDKKRSVLRPDFDGSCRIQKNSCRPCRVKTKSLKRTISICWLSTASCMYRI